MRCYSSQHSHIFVHSSNMKSDADDPNKQKMEEALLNKEVRLKAIKSFVRYQQAEVSSRRETNSEAKQNTGTKQNSY